MGLTPVVIELITSLGGDTMAFRCDAAALITATASAAVGSPQSAN